MPSPAIAELPEREPDIFDEMTDEELEAVRAKIRNGREQFARGEGIPGPQVFAEIAARFKAKTGLTPREYVAKFGKK